MRATQVLLLKNKSNNIFKIIILSIVCWKFMFDGYINFCLNNRHNMKILAYLMYI